MINPPICGDNPRALALGLSPVKMDNHNMTILFHQQHFRHCNALHLTKDGKSRIKANVVDWMTHRSPCG